MAWTYSGNPATNDKDAVRFLVGDTKQESPLATDEEIAWALTQETNIYLVAALVAEGIASYFATQAESTKIGPLVIQYGQRAKVYAEKAQELRKKSARYSSLDIQAGVDAETTEPIFSVGMHDINSLSGFSNSPTGSGE